MASAGMLLYNLISRVTVKTPSLLDDFLHDSKTLGIIVVWLVYHLLACEVMEKPPGGPGGAA
jgi:hypothetical protein